MTTSRSRTLLVPLAGVFLIGACAGPTTGTPTSEPGNIDLMPKKVAGGAAAEFQTMMSDVNSALEAEGANYRIAMVEYTTHASSMEAGGTVLAKDVGNKQLTADFVPGDSRRTWSGPNGTSLTYAMDQTIDGSSIGGSLSVDQTNAAIEAATETWEAQSCSNLGLTRAPDFEENIGVIAFINGFGGSPFVFADVQHGGFREINYSGGTLAATHTFVFIDGGGFPTDINNDGKQDTAFREIYYDPSWVWGVDGAAGAADLETISLHEIGHGLSQAHFGTVRINNKGSLQASPRAVMNALYDGPFRDLVGADNGGHCSIWSNWPNH